MQDKINEEDLRFDQIRNWDYLVYLKKWPQFYLFIWESFRPALVSLIKRVHTNNQQIIIISTSGIYPTWLSKKYKEFEWNFDKPNALVSGLADTYGVEFINMKGIYRTYKEDTGQPVMFRHDGHLNENGHQLVADTLYHYIIANVKL